MSDVKGKGKQRSMNEQEMAAARKEIRHYRLILRESCPAEHLPLLMQSTARWMNALRVALTYVADVREALSTVEAVGMSTRDETKDGDGAGGGRDATDSPEHDAETSCRVSIFPGYIQALSFADLPRVCRNSATHTRIDPYLQIQSFPCLYRSTCEQILSGLNPHTTGSTNNHRLFPLSTVRAAQRYPRNSV